MVLSIEERVVVVVEYVFREDNKYTDVVQDQTFICGEQQNLQCIVIAHARLKKLKTAITAYIRDILQADL
jgi:hypothetical protein